MLNSFVGLASPTEEFMVYCGERVVWVIEVTFPGKPGHASLFIEDNAVEKLVCFGFLCCSAVYMWSLACCFQFSVILSVLFCFEKNS